MQDIPHLRIWWKGVDNALADVPSRWSSHVKKISGLVKDLPLAPLRIHEIIRRLFKAPEEVDEMIADHAVERQAQTTLGLPAPVEQDHSR